MINEVMITDMNTDTIYDMFNEGMITDINHVNVSQSLFNNIMIRMNTLFSDLRFFINLRTDTAFCSLKKTVFWG